MIRIRPSTKVGGYFQCNTGPSLSSPMIATRCSAVAASVFFNFGNQELPSQPCLYCGKFPSTADASTNVGNRTYIPPLHDVSFLLWPPLCFSTWATWTPVSTPAFTAFIVVVSFLPLQMLALTSVTDLMYHLCMTSYFCLSCKLKMKWRQIETSHVSLVGIVDKIDNSMRILGVLRRKARA